MTRLWLFGDDGSLKAVIARCHAISHARVQRLVEVMVRVVRTRASSIVVAMAVARQTLACGGEYGRFPMKRKVLRSLSVLLALDMLRRPPAVAAELIMSCNTYHGYRFGR